MFTDTRSGDRFAGGFHLLLPYDDLSSTPQFADSYMESMFTVYAMMLGGFETELFWDARFPVLSATVFVVFMFIVAVIMLNAVIAIMVC